MGEKLMKETWKVPKRNHLKPIDCNGSRVKVGDKVLILCYDTLQTSFFRPAIITKIEQMPGKWCTKEIRDHKFTLQYVGVNNETKRISKRSTQIMQHNRRILLIKDEIVAACILFEQAVWWLTKDKELHGTTRRNSRSKKTDRTS